MLKHIYSYNVYFMIALSSILIILLVSDSSEHDDPHLMIVGEWLSENDNNSVWVFTEANTYLSKYDGEIIGTGTWEFVLECEGEYAHDDDFGMLEILFDDGDTHCYVVQGLNGALTLLALPHGRLLIFDRE